MLRRRLVWLAIVAAGVAVASLEQAPPAGAGVFQIKACTADTQNWSSQAFQEFATRGMRWKRACNPEGEGLSGLVTGNVVRSGRVARGAGAYFVLNAPPGTQFATLWWSGQARRRDCRYALQLWADAPDGHVVPIKNVRANRGCPPGFQAQGGGWPAARPYAIGGTTRIVQRAICAGAPGRPYCSGRGLNFIRTWKALADVVDNVLPSVRILEDNPFTTGQWVNGRQNVNYDAVDNVGVKQARAMVGGTAYGEHVRPCDFTQSIPCPNGPGVITVDTTELGEGSQVLELEALDAADNTAMSSGGTTIRVDNTAPGAVSVTVAGGESWRNQNDFDLTWLNPGEGDRAPITGAYYRTCRADGSECKDGSRAGLGIDRLSDVTVPEPGEWQVRVWREDAATNSEPANASVPVTLRFDPEPPQLGFEELSASDPTQVTALVTDRVSGLAGGELEISREGSGLWQTLTTRVEGNRLIARIDDALLPPGSYRLRATARDHAGNQNSSQVRLDGQPMVMSLPIRIPTGLRAGIVRTRADRAEGRRQGKRHRQRQVVTLDPGARVAFGRQVTVSGRLQNRDGQPIPDAEILVLSRAAGTTEQLAGALRTDAQGKFTHVTRANSTQTLRFVFQGTALMLPSQSEVSLSVPAASTIRARPRSLRNGRTVRFAGRVRSLPIPPAGKLIELQVVLSGDWQTFRTTYTDPAGEWNVPYRFERTCGLTRYRFRARLPAEASYPFETGVTRAVNVRVRGGTCR